MTLTTTGGYSDEECGYSGAFGWSKHPSYPGKWMVTCFETSFSVEHVLFAVVDDFGNLVRVPS